MAHIDVPVVIIERCSMKDAGVCILSQVESHHGNLDIADLTVSDG